MKSATLRRNGEHEITVTLVAHLNLFQAACSLLHVDDEDVEKLTRNKVLAAIRSCIAIRGVEGIVFLADDYEGDEFDERIERNTNKLIELGIFPREARTQ